MPKFNEFIKGFEEKETAPKAQEPQEGQEQQKPYKTIGDKEHYIVKYDDFSKAMSGNPKANFTIRSKKTGEDFDLGSASGLDFETEEEAKKTIDNWEKHAQEKKEEEALDKRFAEEDKAIKKYLAMGYDRDEAQQKANIDVNYGGDFDKNYEYGKDKEWNKAPTSKDNEKGQRIVNYGGKDMTLDEAKEEYKKAVAIPALKRTPKQEAYLDKSAEYDIAQDELYKKWYEEKDPQKKAELKEQMDTLDKEYARFLNEWEEAERNRYKKD